MELQPLDKILETTSAFKILADPTRFKIICLLMKHRDGMCVHEIADTIEITQSAASHQLAKLEARDVVSSYREGQMVCYSLKDTPFTKNLERVISIFTPRS